jgi:MoaA/NifB/PqqE/SkfB family radical SAM enzyme
MIEHILQKEEKLLIKKLFLIHILLGVDLNKIYNFLYLYYIELIKEVIMYIYSTIKVAKAVILANFFNIKTPINVMWRINNQCNSKCNYCDIHRRKCKEPSTKQILSLIDQMKKAGTQRIGFVGGEPLLRKDLGIIIDYCKKKDIFVTVVTNGSLVLENLKLLKKIDYLVISFDGRKINHEKNRGINNYKNLLKVLKIAPKYCPVLTHTVITKNNLSDYDYILNLAKKNNFKSIFCILQGDSNIKPSGNEYKHFFKKLLRKKEKGFPISNSKAAMKFFIQWNNYNSTYSINKNEKSYKCWAGKLMCDIDTDGRISPCCNIYNKNSMNVYKDGFLKSFQKIKKPKCKTCISFSNLIEYNLLYSLRFSTILEWLKIILIKK